MEQDGMRTADTTNGSTTGRSNTDARTYKLWHVLSITTLTSIATIIGSGILALPVSLHDTSLPLFLVIFTVVFGAVLLVIQAAVDLMHLTYRKELLSKGAADVEMDSLLNDDQPNVSLFHMATTYLPGKFIQFVFHASTLISLLSLIVSYGLAGPQALYQLATGSSASPPTLLLFIYSMTGTLLVVFFVDHLLPFFSSLTIVKGTLFVFVVVLVSFFLPPSVQLHSPYDLLFNAGRDGEIQVFKKQSILPFLISCVALGALPNTMPMTFELLLRNGYTTPRHVAMFRWSVMAGLFFCYVLNVGWVIAVMQIVPRSALADAFDHGYISTVPLIDTLSASSTPGTASVIAVISTVVNLFILFSAVVSFFIMMAGCKNYIDGAATTYRLSDARRLAAYVPAFGAMVLTVVCNPNGFIEILTNVTSFTMNLQSGALIFVMLACSAAVRTRPTHPHDNALMGPRLRAVIVVAGLTIFSVACLLVLIAPLLGISVSGPSE